MSPSELNLILLGPPGAGKGTQAERLREAFPLAYVATGDMLRQARKQGTELGHKAQEYMDRGDLVPDDVVIGIALERLTADDARDGFLLDGFPRTVPQADALAEKMADHGRRITAVLLVEVPDEEIVRRISGRRVSSSGKTYHVEHDPPQQEGRCDLDGSPLQQREDDKPDVVLARLAKYHHSTAPLVEYYEAQGLLHRFDGARPPAEVNEHIRATLATLRLEDEL